MKFSTLTGGLIAAALVFVCRAELCRFGIVSRGLHRRRDRQSPRRCRGSPKPYRGRRCQYITPADNNNVANETNVNAAMFFGFSDWDVLTGVSQVIRTTRLPALGHSRRRA